MCLDLRGVALQPSGRDSRNHLLALRSDRLSAFAVCVATSGKEEHCSNKCGECIIRQHESRPDEAGLGIHPDLVQKQRAEKNKTGGQWRKSARRWVLAELC